MKSFSHKSIFASIIGTFETIRNFSFDFLLAIISFYNWASEWKEQRKSLKMKDKIYESERQIFFY